MNNLNQKIKALMLAAGFGTRLKEIGQKTAKGLFTNSNNRTITDMMLNRIVQQKEMDEIALVTNNHFYQQYHQFLSNNYPQLSITILNDGCNQAQNRLGSLGDLVFSLNKLDWWQSNVLVLPSDRNPNKIITNLIKLLKNNKDETAFYTAIVHLSKDKIKKRSGCAQINSQGQIKAFEEKPQLPKSNWAGLPFYLFTPATLKLLKKYQKTKNSIDSPGNIIPWLLEQNTPIYTYQSHSNFIDIGSLKQLKSFRQMK